MNDLGELRRENRSLRDRFSRLIGTVLRINSSPNLDTVLQGVVDSACALTGASQGHHPGCQFRHEVNPRDRQLTDGRAPRSGRLSDLRTFNRKGSQCSELEPDSQLHYDGIERGNDALAVAGP